MSNPKQKTAIRQFKTNKIMTAKEIYEKHWRAWIEINCGKETANEAEFEEVQHSYIIAAMDEYADTKQKLNKHVVMQEMSESDDYNGITLTCSFDGNVLIRILNALRKHDHELYVELSSRVIDFGTQKLGSS